MTRPSLAAVCVAVLLLALGGCATVDVAPAKGPAAAAPRPSYQIGQRSVRTDGVWELVHAGENVYLFADAHRNEILVSRDLVPMRFLDRTPSVWRPGSLLSEPFGFHPAPRLDWPLAVGKRGASQGSWRFQYDETVVLPSPRNPGATYTRTYTFTTSVEATYAWSVEAYEQVRVPAGTFDAYRVHFRLTSDDPKARKAPTWWMRTWYAPTVRQFVAAEGSNIGRLGFRLASVDPGQVDPLTVVLREPEEGAQSPRDVMGLTGRVAAGAGIARLTVTVNGAEVARQEPPEAPVEMTLDTTVPLREGRNIVIVTATDTGGRSSQQARTVFHDPSRQRAAAETARARMAAARQAAAQAEAARLAAAPWSAGERAAREAEAMVAARDHAGAEEAFGVAAAGYERAGRAAAAVARLAAERAAAGQAREAAERARAGAAAADAGRWAAAELREASAAEAEATSAAGGEEFARAAAAYRAAEQQALARGAAAAVAAREQQAVRRRQREAAERQARAAAEAREGAVAAGAERHAAAAFARARDAETAAAAALARGDAAVAQERYGAAEAGYREAAAGGRAEAERAARVERERAEAARVLAAAARARAAAEQAGASRYAAAATAQATEREREAAAASGRGDHRAAARAGEAARQAWERAAAEARAVAGLPLRFAFDVPSRVEEAALPLAGRLVSARGVARVFVTLNGTTVWRRDEPSAVGDVPVQVGLTLREGHNTIVVTAADAEGRIEQDVRVVRFEPPLPLALEVRYPLKDERVSHTSSVVAAVAGSSRGVTEVRVTLNGREVHRQTERRPQPSVVVAAPVMLTPGVNAIVVTAVEEGGATREETRTVTLDAPRGDGAPAAGAAAVAAREPERWAVVVGIGAYDNPAIPRLALTTPDSEAIYRVLVEAGGFKKENVLHLSDRTERKPTLRTLKWALGTFLARSARKGDTVVIFFAGHGAPEADVAGREGDGLAKYLVPLDADPDDLYATGLPMDEFETIFSRIEADRVVVFLDACYSGAAGGRTFSSRRTRALNVDDGFLQRLVQSRGRVIVTASRANEVSVEVPELGHGLFTYYLVRGLEGAADTNGDTIVTLQELYQYVEQEVTRHSRAIGANQHPTMKGEMEGLLPLVRIRR